MMLEHEDEEDGRCSFEDPDCEPDWLEEAEVASEPPPLAPARLVPLRGSTTERALRACYNRVGGALERAAAAHGVSPALALAVWMVESFGKPHVENNAIVRIENHKLWSAWGKFHPEEYRKHWKHQTEGKLKPDGTRDRVKPWLEQRFRTDSDTPWLVAHNADASGQRVEYASIAKALEAVEAFPVKDKAGAVIASEEVVFPCVSIGGCQILIKHWKMLGYTSAHAMWDAFQGGEEPHVAGFFAFSVGERIIDELQRGDVKGFVSVFNGLGQVPEYTKRINGMLALAEPLLKEAAA